MSASEIWFNPVTTDQTFQFRTLSEFSAEKEVVAVFTFRQQLGNKTAAANWLPNTDTLSRVQLKFLPQITYLSCFDAGWLGLGQEFCGLYNFTVGYGVQFIWKPIKMDREFIFII